MVLGAAGLLGRWIAILGMDKLLDPTRDGALSILSRPSIETHLSSAWLVVSIICAVSFTLVHTRRTRTYPWSTLTGKPGVGARYVEIYMEDRAAVRVPHR